MSDTKPLVLELGTRTKVDEEADRQAAAVKIIQDLGAMLVYELRCGFDFEKNHIKAEEIRLKVMGEGPFLVGKRKVGLGTEGNAARGEFEDETFGVDRFGKSEPHVVIDLKACADDLKGFIFMNEFSHPSDPRKSAG